MRISNPVYVLVTGGRDLKDWPLVEYALRAKAKEVRSREGLNRLVVVQGGCPTGADRHARAWCRKSNNACISVPAQWTIAGTAAGPVRNREMLAWFPDIEEVFAFPGGRGTADMVSAATLVAGLRVQTFWEMPQSEDDL